jgi:hypothetical protein
LAFVYVVHESCSPFHGNHLPHNFQEKALCRENPHAEKTTTKETSTMPNFHFHLLCCGPHIPTNFHFLLLNGRKTCQFFYKRFKFIIFRVSHEVCCHHLEPPKLGGVWEDGIELAMAA